jgi:Flp pilus assembly protein TadG
MLAGQVKSRRRGGAAAVEFAVVLTFLMPLLVGTWEVGRMVQVQQLLFNAAREGARQAAAGQLTAAGVQQAVVNYMAFNGFSSVTTSNVTVTNLTSSSRSNPVTANQMDEFQVTVSIPFSSVRWVVLKQITSTTQLSATSTWYSMNDLPVTVDTTIPLN